MFTAEIERLIGDDVLTISADYYVAWVDNQDGTMGVEPVQYARPFTVNDEDISMDDLIARVGPKAAKEIDDALDGLAYELAMEGEQ